MTGFERPTDSLPIPEQEHDILLIAGSRPEVARLAPVATAFTDAGRITALTVATGPEPMLVHEAFEALGVPADITLLLPEPPRTDLASVAATLLPRIDDLLVEIDPSAVMVQGGGMTATVAAQAAFWRQIPVVHLQAGVGTDDVLCPFPEEANRRIIGQLASLFLTTGTTVGSTTGPNTIHVGDTLTCNPQPADLRFARIVQRIRSTGLPRLVLVGLDRPGSLGVLTGLPDLLADEPQVEVVVYGELARHPAAHALVQHPRGTVVRSLPLAELVNLIAASTVLVSDDPGLVTDAPALGTPAVLVDGPHAPQPGDSIRSIGSSSVLAAVRELVGLVKPRPEPPDGLAAARVEQAVAWMFGLTPTPHLSPSQRENTEA